VLAKRKNSSGSRSSITKTIIISRSLTREVLQYNRITTSSEKFERGFVREYAKLSEVEVVTLGGKRHDPELVKDLNISVSRAGLLNLIWRIIPIKRSGVSTIMVTGYDARLMIILILFRVIGVRAFAFIYDSHRQSLADYRIAKRLIIDSYFSIGFYLAKFLDGWIVLNDGFILRSNFSIPYLLTGVGVDPDILGDDRKSSRRESPMAIKSTMIFLFSGTLNYENGISLLIEAFCAISLNDAQLHIYGDGKLADFVVQASRNDKRIIFFGRVDNDVLTSRQTEATYLIHLRDPNSIASEYSYPSKLIEYLCSGTPVMSNIFPGIGDVANYVIPISDYSAVGVGQALIGVLNGKAPLPRETSVEAWLVAHRGWARIASDIKEFVTGSAETAPGESGHPRGRP